MILWMWHVVYVVVIWKLCVLYLGIIDVDSGDMYTYIHTYIHTYMIYTDGYMT